MLCLIASDNQANASRLREALLARGAECPLANVVSLDASLHAVLQTSCPADVIFLDLSVDVERSFEVLQRLRHVRPAKIVAVGSARDPQLILRALHCGTDDYLDADADPLSELERLAQRLSVHATASDKDGRLIAITSASGGSGCSTLAANLAAALSRRQGGCLLCDFDLRQGDLATLFDLKPRHTIIDLCRNLQKLDQKMFDQSLAKHKSGVSLLAAPQSFAEVEQITPKAAESILKMARQSSPFVVVDLEDFFHREQSRVLELADVMLLVLRLDFNSLRNAHRTLNYLATAGIDAGKVQLVLNQFGRANELPKSDAEQALETKFVHVVPDDPKTVVASVNRGVPVVCEFPRSPYGKAVQELAERLGKRLTPAELAAV